MKNTFKTLFAFILLCIGTQIYAQDTTDLNPKPDFTYQEHQGRTVKTETIQLAETTGARTTTSGSRSSSAAEGTTYGELSVSRNGAANYNIPIAVPPGIDGVVPGVSISYNSQSGHGMAGFGWNVAGLSTITRIPANKFHDGIIDPVDFDHLDRFALDGQRLILKSGSYGANGAIYETENYSNLKIVSYGVSSYGASYGPAYFIVFYPDGSKAYYGTNTNSRSRLEYAITYKQNPQGIRINYAYTTAGNSNLITIDKITYGAKNSGTPINEIRFGYTSRRPHISYVKGIRFIRKSFLSNIKVLGKGNGFRNYYLDYEYTDFGINRLKNVTEKNGNNTKARGTISFSYPTTQANIEHELDDTNLGLVNIEQRNAEVVSLDLTGNAKMDFIVYPKPTRNKLWVFKNGRYERPYTINLPRFETVFPTSWLSHQNKILEGQGFTVLQHESTNKVNFKVYANGSTSPISQQYTKTWYAPTYAIQSSCNTGGTTRRVPQEYLSGDFNGDGLTDVIAISKSYSQSSCYQVPPAPGENCGIIGPGDEEQRASSKIGSSNMCCKCNSSTVNTGRVSFIDLDRRVTAGFSSVPGFLRNPVSSSDRFQTSDVNGDGKTDILHFTSGKVIVYQLDKNNKLQFLWETGDYRIKTNHPMLIGDYNGDGKADFMTPHANNSTTYHIYESGGDRFVRKQTVLKFKYRLPYSTGGANYGFNYIPIDINGDGKTDLLEYLTTTYDNGSAGKQQVKVHYNYLHPTTTTYIPQFAMVGSASHTGNVHKNPVPVFLSSNRPNHELEFATISNKWVSSFKVSRNIRNEGLLTGVFNNGVNQYIAYGDMNPHDQNPIYTSATDQVYPYVNLHALPGVKLVKQLTRATSDNSIPTKKRTFFYKGAVMHASGIGFVGFQETAQSNWHTSRGNRIYTNFKNNPQLRGAVIDQYQTPYDYRFGGIPSDYITKTRYAYGNSLSSRKVFKHWVNSSTNQNRLEGTTTTSHYQYDGYLNPTKQTVNYSGHGSTVTTNTYANSTGSSYYIGRLTNQKVTSTIAGNNFSTEEQYSYSGYLVSTKKTKGNNTQWDTESFTYDTFGNLKQSTVSPYGESSRTLKYEYDTSGRFLKTATDVLGLVTSYVYDVKSGLLTSEKNAYNQTTSYTYDTWNRVLRVTDYLGNSTNTSYSKSGTSDVILTSSADGSSTSSRFDVLGRKINDRKKSFAGNWVQVSYEYDALDRISRQSEPHFGSAPTQWNTTSYDLYGRTTRQNAYTGRVVTYSYNGLAVTVNDGTKSVTTTTNAMGNVTRVNDPGGTITYSYYGNGNLRTSSYSGATQSIVQDGWGRKTKLTDPSAGVYTYEYNGYGNVTKETTPKGTTTNRYDAFGRISQSKITGDHTNMTTNYSYDNTTKQLKSISATDAIHGRSYSYIYGYDQHKRPKYIVENTGSAKFEVGYTYDGYSRIQRKSYKAEVLGAGQSTTNVNYTYDTHGNSTGFEDWKIKNVNAREQITQIELGTGGTEAMQYDSYGYLKKNTVKAKNATENYIDNSYTFNASRGTLTKRTQTTKVAGYHASYAENFTYDNLDRLQKINGPFAKNKNYDSYGRTTSDTRIGSYLYQSGSKRYQLKEINLNPTGVNTYRNTATQKITYNAYKKPVEVFVNSGGRVSFEYGPMRNRVQAWYGGSQSNKSQRRYHKLYSSIIPAEIVHDKQQNRYKYVFFKGGDAYTAPVARIEKITGGSSDGGATYHLQRDYLGSILNITKQNGSGTSASGVLEERRQFGAWGTVDRFWSRTAGTTMNHSSILDRGYTGHEHFFEVGLIHMNGRMYDSQLGRFMSPDNYIQNPYSTQNYNRYSYVLNNPLMYNDPSGETYEDPTEGGGDEIPGSVIGGAIATAINSGRGLRVAGWFEGAVVTPIRRFVRGLFGGKSDKPKVVETPQLQINSDPLVNPSPTVPSVFTSNGLSFGETLINIPMYFQTGMAEHWVGSLQGFARVIQDPASLFTAEAFKQRAIMAIDQVTSLGVPGTGIVSQFERMQAHASGDIGAITRYYGRQMGQLQMEALSLIPAGRGFSAVGKAGRGLSSFSKGVTTADGFLFKGFTVKAPFNIPVQRFGNMNLGRPDFWGPRIGTSKFANRVFGAIKPSWNPLTQYTKGVIPKGTLIKFGIIGPQGWKYPGGSLQFITFSRGIINQSSKIIQR